MPHFFWNSLSFCISFFGRNLKTNDFFLFNFISVCPKRRGCLTVLSIWVSSDVIRYFASLVAVCFSYSVCGYVSINFSIVLVIPVALNQYYHCPTTVSIRSSLSVLSNTWIAATLLNCISAHTIRKILKVSKHTRCVWCPCCIIYLAIVLVVFVDSGCPTSSFEWVNSNVFHICFRCFGYPIFLYAKKSLNISCIVYPWADLVIPVRCFSFLRYVSVVLIVPIGFLNLVILILFFIFFFILCFDFCSHLGRTSLWYLK